jgi:hypothetical protein
MGPRRRWCLVPALLLAVVIAGCSRLQILYDQADWMLLGFIEEQVRLDDDQRERLSADIAGLMDWHCRVEMPAYGALIGEIVGAIDRGGLGPEQVGLYSDRIEALWDRILDRAAPALAALFADLSPEQARDLNGRLERAQGTSDRRIRKAVADRTARDYRARATNQFERWLGPLNPRQEAVIDAWSRAFQPLGHTGLNYRRRLQGELRDLIARRHGDPAGMETALRDFIARMPLGRPPAYARLVTENRALTHRLVADVFALMDGVQRGHLRDFAGRLRTDIAAIRCG